MNVKLEADTPSIITDPKDETPVVKRIVNIKTSVEKPITLKTAPDTKAPVITLKGKGAVTINIGQKYEEPSFSARDDKDGLVIVDVSGKIDINKLGKYKLIYKAVDHAGNSATDSRVVTVIQEKKSNDSQVIRKSGAGSMSYLLLVLGLLIGLRQHFNRNKY